MHISSSSSTFKYKGLKVVTLDPSGYNLLPNAISTAISHFNAPEAGVYCDGVEWTAGFDDECGCLYGDIEIE